MRVYKLDEKLECICGHKWGEHKHGTVLNPQYFSYPLTIGGMLAQECEHNQVNGSYFKSRGEKEYCMCSNFKPRARNVQKLVEEWITANDPR